MHQHAPYAGHDCLENAAKVTIQRILKENPTPPHKVCYYTEHRDPEFNKKMHHVFVVYQEVNTQNVQQPSGQDLPIITMSIDEKPGSQAIKSEVSAELAVSPESEEKFLLARLPKFFKKVFAADSEDLPQSVYALSLLT